MDLDAIGWIASLLRHWRAVFCLAASSGLAIVLVRSFTWLNGLQGMAIAALGLIPVVLWHTSSAEPALQSPAPTPISVAALAAVLAGATWGAVSAASMHSFLAGLAYPLSALVAHPLF